MGLHSSIGFKIGFQFGHVVDMNRRDLLKASAAGAAVALNVLGLRNTRAEANEVYIDPNAYGTGHSGSYADPYSTADALVYFSLLHGDLGGHRIRFKADTTFVGGVTIQRCDNYFLEPYDDGPAPIISNHVDISSLTWLPEVSCGLQRTACLLARLSEDEDGGTASGCMFGGDCPDFIAHVHRFVSAI